MHKYFELPDGKKFETDNKNTCKVRFSACDCIIIYDTMNTIHQHTVSKCKIHKSLNGGTLLDEVIKHSQDIVKAHANYPNLNESDWVSITKNISDEKQRIRKL